VNDPSAIVTGVAASAESYEWAVPCSLPAVAMTSTTGMGMLIIEDGTGIFQYSTQFAVLANKQCGSSSPSSSGSSSGSTTAAPSSTTTTMRSPGYFTSIDDEGHTYGGHNGTKPTDKPGPSSSWSTVTGSVTVTGIAAEPTDAPTVTYSTASTTSSPTGTVESLTPGNAAPAQRNAAGALFLGALGAAFLL
jgi:hypothetical protein